jgi:hypothetical protein
MAHLALALMAASLPLPPTSSPPQPCDLFGKTITLGDLIVYGQNLGGVSSVRIGKVLAIQPNPVPGSSDDEDYSPWVMVVWGLERIGEKQFRLAKNKGRIQHPDRCTVARPDQFPEYVQTLLAPITALSRIKDGKLI